MCRPTATNATKQKRPVVSSWTTKAGIAFALFVLAAPALISEAIGGWTRKYTSATKFSAATSIPNLTGQTAIVTGANTGIGFETALELARHGATVVVAARSVAKGKAAVQRIQDEVQKDKEFTAHIQFLQLDLASLDSVERFATLFLELDLPLHKLILNAGVMKSPGEDFVGEMKYGFDTTQDGFEYHIGVNHVAHAHLTKLLGEKLQASSPSRVVSVSSIAEQGSYEQGIVFDEWVPAGGKAPASYEDGKAYGQSKLANLLFAAELASRWNGTGVTAYALHPGVIQTDLSRYMEPVMEEQMMSNGKLAYYVQRMVGQLFEMALFNAKDGALTQLHLATAPVETLVNGAMYHPIGRVEAAAHAQGSNRTLQTMLWEETQRAIEMRGDYHL